MAAGEKKADKANPAHYRKHGAMSSIHIITHYGLGFELGNAIKYLLRAGTKPGETEVDDLRKARWYINRRLHIIDPKNNACPSEGPVTG